MGKSEERKEITAQAGESTVLSRIPSEASKMLEAALLQMDDIISGACTESNNEVNAEWKDSVKEATRNLLAAIKSAPSVPPPPDPATIELLIEWMQPACPASYAKMLAFHGSTGNLCAAGSFTHLPGISPFCTATPATTCSSYTGDVYHRYKSRGKHPSGLPQQSCQGEGPPTEKFCEPTDHRREHSLEGRRRRYRNRAERDQRARSQCDLLCRKRHTNRCCSHEYFHCAGNDSRPIIGADRVEERLRKLENERGALRMEVSVLSDQVDAQSAKIQELEGMLREKKDSLRRMEEALQKEVLSRSALETQKLELLSSLSEMKLRQASLEHENVALRNGSPLANGDRFARHAHQYSSLPRGTGSTKKGVAFAEEEKIVVVESSPQESMPPKSLAELSMEEIGDWLSKLGLENYAPELRRWGATGEKLLEANQQQLEKEFDIKNTLHRKKLLYAIESEKTGGAGFLGSDKMDNAAVLRWLDDIGLPQHKDAFQAAKVDGRVLHRLTTEDLLNLGVTAQLHAASLRRGIQVLRELNFEFDNLERRSSTGNGADGSNVTLWTNHRVMEWLRVVDLAEYAPNMRGSGVHGGLMVYEPGFTSELLATLLSISPGKTLLRRHLTTHFNQILGREIVQRKREIESTVGFVPLTLTARLKVPKKSQFTLKRKKSKNEADYGNLVCPLDVSPSAAASTSSSTPGSPNMSSPTF